MSESSSRAPTLKRVFRSPVRRFLTLIVLLAAVTGPALIGNITARVDSPRLSTFDSQMLTLVNGARDSAGLAYVQSASGLTNLSLWWSNQLAGGATGGVLQHNPNAFAQTVQYGASNRTAWAENVAKWTPATVTASQIFNAYMASPGHKANILGSAYRFIGIGSVTDSSGVSWNTMTFTDKVDNPDVISWQKTAYNPTIYSVSGGSHHAATYGEWAGAGFPTPTATYTEYVHYPWSPSIYAVTFWADEWEWDKLDFNSWASAGYPAPRVAGWIAGSTVWKNASSPVIYLTDPEGQTHPLTYAEWSAAEFRTPEVR